VLQKLKSFIDEHQLFDKSDQIALATSGGKDSVYAAHMLNEMEISFIMVHVNFNLRGAESNADQKFVEKLADSLPYCIALHVFNSDTTAYMAEHKTNVQDAARKIRYAYFEKLKNEGVFDKLVTAHHKSDVLETFMINLYRQSGIKGLSSIPLRRDYIIRPLMCFSSEEILEYLQKNNLDYRDDSSNESMKYLRNTFRKKVLPSIIAELPNFEERASKSIAFLKEENDILDFLISKEIDQNIASENGRIKIPKNTVLGFPHPHVFLYRIIDRYGFNPHQCSQIADACYAESGKEFTSNSSQLIVDREFLYINDLNNNQVDEIKIVENGQFDYGNYSLTISSCKSPVFNDNKLEETVELSHDLFPLTLRTWKEGDRIQPLGMSGTKLLSDFFVDEKVDVYTKNTIPLLCSEKEVLWVPGHRISDKLKVRGKQNLYVLSLKNNQ